MIRPATSAGNGTNRSVVVCSIALLIFVSQTVGAEPVVFESGPKKVQLLELFTSEGCSSCPPAEASLGRLVSDPRLWHEFVPVAFHVDYWDRLGWKDPFASAEWTTRQRLYAANWNADSVYTPAFVLNGREWRDANVPRLREEAPGALKATVRGDNTVVIDFEPARREARDFEVYLVRLGFGISMNVRAGENSGRNLHHDFVVLSLTHEKIAAHGSRELHLPLPRSDIDTISNRTAAAVWITRAGDITPVQAAGGWLSPEVEPGK